MAYRIVYTEYWEDPKVMEEMTPEDRYFYLYLLTNPHTTSIGIYTITKKQMALELGYSIESVNALMDRFINHHKFIRYNNDTRELAIKNWGKYNLRKGGKPVMDCLAKELGLVKDKSLINYVGENIKSEAILSLYEKFYDTPTNREPIVPRQVDNTETETKTETYTKTETETENNTEKHKGYDPFLGIAINSEDVEALSLSNYFKKATGSLEDLNLNALKVAIKQHKAVNVRKAIDKAVAVGKPYMSYVSGILRNWEKEGYPGEECSDGLKTPRQSGKVLKFTDYPQREYDYGELEKRLLGWE